MSIGDLAIWLVAESERRPTLPELFDGFCLRLGGMGIDLWRVILGLETLHPEVSGTLLRWDAGEITKIVTDRAGILTSDTYLRSPTRIVDETGRPFRWRAGEDTMGMPRLEDYATEGVSDYVMLPLPFLDTTRTAVVAYATKAEGGFQPPELEFLDTAARLLSPWAERTILRRIATDLLTAYLGPGSGRRVYDGQIERGDVHTIHAALWCCDLRGFTALSDRLPRAKLVGILNRWFDVIGVAIEDGGGEILKFMGDGLLAVFPLSGEEASTCDRALQAAEQAVAGSRTLDELLAKKGEPPLRFGLALHVGDVEYGNIGTRQRLDFTVIGPAVNMASRLESITKELGVAAVASAEFATATSRTLPSLGRHSLRGIAAPVEVFGLL
ncbi:MAG: adenylate/guanylate cyclase domain-containing protein [Geminicoccaceae bacterium]